MGNRIGDMAVWRNGSRTGVHEEEFQVQLGRPSTQIPPGGDTVIKWSATASARTATTGHAATDALSANELANLQILLNANVWATVLTGQLLMLTITTIISSENLYHGNRLRTGENFW